MADGVPMPVPAVPDLHYIDTGMYDVDGYGAVYILDTAEPAVVDTGIGTHVDRVLTGLEEVGIGRESLAHILVTHVHLDHAGGAGFLAEACPNATVAVHDRGARHLVDPARLWAGTKRAVGDEFQFYTEPTPVPEGRIRELSDGDVIDLGERSLDVHDAPGHAPHQVCFHDPTTGTLFTADAAGIYVRERDDVYPTTPPPDFDLEASLATLETLAGLEPATLCYAHFGPRAADGMLGAYADVLEGWVATVGDRRNSLGDDDAVVEALAADAPLTDVWGQRKARADVAMNARGVLHALESD